jgi:hypothetical protein
MVVIPVATSNLPYVEWNRRSENSWGYGSFVREHLVIPVIMLLFYVTSPMFSTIFGILTFVKRKTISLNVRMMWLLIICMSIIAPIVAIDVISIIVDWIDS